MNNVEISDRVLLKEVTKYKLGLRLTVCTDVSFHIDVNGLIEVPHQLLCTAGLQRLLHRSKNIALRPGMERQ